ncbi:Thioredoxin-like protein [Glarea lozoyensis ATCC 20868]|uniref:Thioredoxin-like protein n=1 Tax=Glarea lozoyensis (strain ATCC 20868 / MF5171) TaxID=1116229 RepID=S3CRF4_GLAL2|nr:Thioredoxin-like protein [Glarea lozoyensis ATCC 20868]EPE27684.1 Thioredoxin-like protein [Glarea lozoyensis ATCC 20868]
MTINTHSSTTTPHSLSTSLSKTPEDTKYIIFYASINPSTGKSWCGDCRDAEPLIERRFAEEGRDVEVVFVGVKTVWRDPENVWKKKPFAVEKLPTLLKITGDKWDKLVEADVYDQAKLDAFLKD